MSFNSELKDFILWLDTLTPNGYEEAKQKILNKFKQIEESEHYG